ncbi:MAG: C1 family peptidase [Candidatus Zixiibacteriota bacterium]
MNRAIIPSSLIAIIAFATIAQAQSQQQIIDSLRAVGEREGWTFTIGLTDACQYSIEQLCGMRVPDQLPANVKTMPPLTTSISDFPTRFDWRELGGVTPVKDQKACGSCWAFATVGSLECNLKIRDGITVDLSEQYLVSCNSDDWSCDGGWWAHNYHLPYSDPYAKTDDCGGYGPVFEADFPYTAKDDSCACPYPHQDTLCLDDWGYISFEYDIPTVDQIKQAILTYGPVGVAVYASSNWTYYTGGIWNVCSDVEINHAVVLVGWDDMLGAEGCWIMRNSWGSSWGEGGYMYIEYGCSRIGFNGVYVDCGLSPTLYFWGDTLYGGVPHTVNFNAFYPDPVDIWSWDFGDDGTASVKAPSHTFNERGSYDVSLSVTSPGGDNSLTKEYYVVAIADTLMTTDVYGQPGEQVVLTVSTFNSAPTEYFKIPVEFANDFGMRYDSFSTVGCRTEYFAKKDYLHYDIWFGQRFTLRLQSDTLPALPPGDGAIVKLYFTLPGTATVGKMAPIFIDGYTVTTTTYLATYSGDLVDYEVPVISGSITVGEYCCAVSGDANHNGAVDIDDIIYLVDWNFASGPGPSCLDEVEVDGLQPFTIEDLVYLVNYVCNGGPAPAGCP